MSHTDYYNQVAELYDACVQVDFDVPFFLAEATRTKGTVLELMSGSGRVSLPLIQAGVPLTCVDLSEGLLAVLRRKLDTLGLSAELHLLDVRELALSRQFELIFIPFHSFPEVTNVEDEQRVLERVADHLSNTGRFICTLHNPPVRLRAADQPYGLWLKRPLPNRQGQVLLWGSQHYEPEREIMTVTEFFEVYDQANMMQARHLVELNFRLLTRVQFESMATKAGFRVEALYGDYSHAAFDESSSPFMIWILRK
jgi:ubiquinone/menaquinone biosynthesis C-methylase UbiE